MDTTQTPKSSQRSMRQKLREPATRVKLPTGETISNYQQSRRIQIPGFPPTTESLPANLLTEDIIKQWPNHLWGPLLLQIAAHWSPKQISSLSGGRLKPNLIAHRVKAARIQAGETPREQVQGNKKSRKRKRDDGAAPEICDTEQLEVESEASRQFLINQLELEEAVKLKDPEFELRQMGCRKKMPRLDRILIDQAFEEREKKRKVMAKKGDIEVVCLD